MGKNTIFKIIGSIILALLAWPLAEIINLMYGGWMMCNNIVYNTCPPLVAVFAWISAIILMLTAILNIFKKELFTK
jgi:hypothetical protein